ncbi:MAG: rhomboid family intramembrane serine protease [Candidatus Aminicenantes bacterium]|nr:MAG: rhomboid family intramembrane serine protease [Candidatus Aminicenantes bacterium]
MFIPIKDYNPTRRTSYITIALIIINIAVFFYQAVLSEKPLTYHILSSAMVPYEVTHFKNAHIPLGKDLFDQPVYFKERDINPFLSLLISIFMHGSLWHLLGNMLFLWIFGNNIEDYLGKMRFIFFYLGCGLGASLIHILFHFNSLSPVIGASGAVSGVMGAYLILFPDAKVRTLVFLFIFITFVDIPAYVFLIVWFIFQFFYAGSQSGIAWLAHVGGFVLGILLIKMMQRRPRIRVKPQRPGSDDIDIEIIQ